MSTEAMREAFEAWAQAHTGWGRDMFGRYSYIHNVLAKLPQNHYMVEQVQHYWDAWQAACAHQIEQDARVCHDRYMELRHGQDLSDPEDDYIQSLKYGMAEELRDTIRALPKVKKGGIA